MYNMNDLKDMGTKKCERSMKIYYNIDGLYCVFAFENNTKKGHSMITRKVKIDAERNIYFMLKGYQIKILKENTHF